MKEVYSINIEFQKKHKVKISIEEIYNSTLHKNKRKYRDITYVYLLKIKMPDGSIIVKEYYAWHEEIKKDFWDRHVIPQLRKEIKFLITNPEKIDELPISLL